MSSPERILLVDDDDSTRNVLRRFLERQQHTVTAVSTADAALTAMDKESFACVLLDVRLPGELDGTELVSRLLALEPDAAIIMLSGVNDATTAALCMHRGARDYLTKPIELADLSAALGRAQRRARG